MRGLVAILAVGMIGLSLAFGGLAPLGRVALALGMPETAVPLFADPEWRGVAQYRAGQFDGAADAFAKAGLRSAYNLGNAEVQRGAYAAGLEAYDLAIADGPDAEAEANFKLVLAFYGGTRIDADAIVKWGEDKEGPTVAADIAQGSARGAGTGDAVTNSGATVGLPAVESRDQLRVRKVFDDKFVVASPRWLATLEDVPGAFLRARILQEHKRRKKAGVGQPAGESEW